MDHASTHERQRTINFQDIYVGDGATQIIQINNADSKLQPSFFKTSNYESFKNINPKRVEDTCLWFLEHKTFQSWRDDGGTRTPVLWLSADPGCGKSVLSRALIDEELLSTNSRERATICYFFFKDKGDQAKITTALCALLHQLFCAHPNLLQKQAASAFKKCENKLRDDFEELWRVFESAVVDEDVGDVICLLDALDECQESDRKPFFDSVERFYKQKPKSKLKLLVTSRPYRQIERGLGKISKICLSGDDESEQISREIAIVINARVEEIAKKLRLDEGVKLLLKRTLHEIPNRTYLWLHLTLDQIEDMIGKTENKVLDVIRRLPRTVEEAYEKILGRCEVGHEEETRKALHIIVAAVCPLTLAELEVAMAIKPDSTSYKDLDLEKNDDDRKQWIRGLCGLFVSVTDSQVFLIHQTAKEFLLRNENCNPGPLQRWQHSIDMRRAHQMLAKICITYQFLDEFKELSYIENQIRLLMIWYATNQKRGLSRELWDLKEDGINKLRRDVAVFYKKNPLSKYSRTYWWHHVDTNGACSGPKMRLEDFSSNDIMKLAHWAGFDESMMTGPSSTPGARDRKDSARCFSRLSETLRATGDLDKAVEFSQKSIKLSSTDGNAHAALADIYMELGDMKNAALSLRTSLTSTVEWSNRVARLRAQEKLLRIEEDDLTSGYEATLEAMRMSEPSTTSRGGDCSWLEERNQFFLLRRGSWDKVTRTIRLVLQPKSTQGSHYQRLQYFWDLSRHLAHHRRLIMYAQKTGQCELVSRVYAVGREVLSAELVEGVLPVFQYLDALTKLRIQRNQEKESASLDDAVIQLMTQPVDRAYFHLRSLAPIEKETLYLVEGLQRVRANSSSREASALHFMGLANEIARWEGPAERRTDALVLAVWKLHSDDPGEAATAKQVVQPIVRRAMELIGHPTASRSRSGWYLLIWSLTAVGDQDGALQAFAQVREGAWHHPTSVLMPSSDASFGHKPETPEEWLRNFMPEFSDVGDSGAEELEAGNVDVEPRNTKAQEAGKFIQKGSRWNDAHVQRRSSAVAPVPFTIDEVRLQFTPVRGMYSGFFCDNCSRFLLTEEYHWHCTYCVIVDLCRHCYRLLKLGQPTLGLCDREHEVWLVPPSTSKKPLQSQWKVPYSVRASGRLSAPPPLVKGEDTDARIIAEGVNLEDVEPVVDDDAVREGIEIEAIGRERREWETRLQRARHREAMKARDTKYAAWWESLKTTWL